MKAGGGISRGVGDIFVGSASVFILLGRTCEVNSPKNKYAQEEKHYFFGFLVSSSICFCCYLGEALRAGARRFTVDDFLLVPGFPP